MRNQPYSRFLRLCGYTGHHGNRPGKLTSSVLAYLNRPFSQIRLELEYQLREAQEAIRAWPLSNYGSATKISTAYSLMKIPELNEWDFLSINPEKTGIVYQPDSDTTEILSDGMLQPLGHADEKISQLSRSLYWWRMAVCTVQAGIILQDLVPYFQKRPQLTAPLSQIFEDRSASPKIDIAQPIGSVLLFVHMTDEEADRLYELYDSAMFGSGSCETSAAEAFIRYTSNLSLGALEQYGLDASEAYTLASAVCERRPEMDIELVWDQEKSKYRFQCEIKNADGHGYYDAKRSAYVPQAVLFAFSRQADAAIQEDLLRLLIRGGWQKAIDLTFHALNFD